MEDDEQKVLQMKSLFKKKADFSWATNSVGSIMGNSYLKQVICQYAYWQCSIQGTLIESKQTKETVRLNFEGQF